MHRSAFLSLSLSFRTKHIVPPSRNLTSQLRLLLSKAQLRRPCVIREIFVNSSSNSKKSYLPISASADPRL